MRSGAYSFEEEDGVPAEQGMHGLPHRWGVFDEQCQRRGIRMAKLCFILRNSMLNVEEQGGDAPGNQQKGVVCNCGMGRYHHGTLRCSRVAIPDFLSLYNVPLTVRLNLDAIVRF